MPEAPFAINCQKSFSVQKRCDNLARNHWTMKFLTIPFALLIWTTALLMPLRGNALINPPTGSLDAMVVLHVDGLDDAKLAKLTGAIGADREVGLEYSCVWSGVVVLRFTNASVSERADIITLAKRQLSAAGIEQGVEVLHVHVQERGPGKC